ncbi:7-cyano-7-deazaguanine synthase [Mesorhizobium newzealandense]|uniref:7-cyano-7-deazaguanine synthase n=1 Tax=Mesorhizobium newzealandense TaxID=1300302 RepID=A0ABW4UCE4_9HYPH
MGSGIESTSPSDTHLSRAFEETFPLALPIARDHLIDMAMLGQVSDIALKRDVESATSRARRKRAGNQIPSCLAATYCSSTSRPSYCRKRAKYVVTGVCRDGSFGLPGTVGYYIWAMQLALNLGLDKHFVIRMPLMGIDKAQTWSWQSDWEARFW